MISKKMQKALNKQINAELYSSYLYYSMSAYFEALNLLGFANWMRIQAMEELTHVQKFYSYVHDRDGRVELSAIDAPPFEWESVLATFKAAYEHEQKVTKMINELVDLAIEEKDHATNNFLQWFVKEQVEEEASAKNIVDRIELVEENKNALFMLDRELGARQFSSSAD